MARKIRVEFPGAIYHILDRGDRHEPIYEDDDDRRSFLVTLGEACARTGWRVHAYVLLSNHYHLLLETPEPNLVKGMHWFQATWTMRFNRKRQLSGHVLQGRYKAVVVDSEAAGGYFATLSDYIHLNPVRAGIVGPEKNLADYAWSSYPAYLFQRRRPPWLVTEVVLGELGLADNSPDRRWYAERMQERMLEEGADEPAAERAQIRRGWCLGGEAFRARITALMAGGGRKARGNLGRDPVVAHDHAEMEAKRLLNGGLKAFGLREEELESLARGDERKAALAALIRSRTMVSNVWTAAALRMGHPSRVTHCLKTPKSQALRRRLEETLAKQACGRRSPSKKTV